LKEGINILKSKSGYETGELSIKTVHIRPFTSWQMLDLRELLEYKDLFYFMVWREVKVLYAQTVIGLSWAILQPVIQIIIFGVVFGKVAQLETDGVPYVLFTTVAIIPWTYMSQAMTQASECLIQSQNMISKVYFPRVIFPITPVLARLIDFSISMIILVGILIYYNVMPTWRMILLPLFIVNMVAIPAGIGFWLSALSVRFRDVKHGMPFFVRMLIYSAPIVYSASSIPENYRLLYSINPIVGTIEGFRACFLGTAIPWMYIAPGILFTFVIFFSGLIYFKKMENIFVDVI
jgi:lipopolysaccharide transport system permease protein